MVEQRKEDREKQGGGGITLKVSCLGHYIYYGKSKHSIYQRVTHTTTQNIININVDFKFQRGEEIYRSKFLLVEC